MDPLVQALIEKYQMTPDLAQRVAANLKQPGAATQAYPKVADAIRQSGWNDQMQAGKQIAYQHQTNTDAGRENDLVVAQSQQDMVDRQLKEKRVAHYNAVTEKARRGEDIGKENRAWLQKVHATSANKAPAPTPPLEEPPDDEDALLRAPGALNRPPAPTGRDEAIKLSNGLIDNAIPALGQPAVHAFTQGLFDGTRQPGGYQAQPVTLESLMATGVSPEAAANYLTTIRGY